MDKYKWFKMGIVKRYTSETMQQLFKTILTDEQILLIDSIMIEEKQRTDFYVALLFVLVIVFGGLIVYMNLKIAYPYIIP
jgi:hypothetical protein